MAYFREPEDVRRSRIALVGGILAVAAFALGPRATFTERWVAPSLPVDLDDWIRSREGSVTTLREGDGKEILWADPQARTRTAISIVYLHGFSADRHEIEPVVSDVAGLLGANVFFTRLAGHGQDQAAMGEATVEAWLDDVAEAVTVGGAIGEKVILAGTSTGGTLAAWAAGRPEARRHIAALVLVSPNLHPKDRASRALLYPWGRQIATAVTGQERCFRPENDRQARHWTTCYPTSALLPMMALVEHVRTMDASAIEVPTLVVMSPDDQVVDAEETRRFVERMSEAEVRVHTVASSSDPASHVVAGDIMSPTSTGEVELAIVAFLQEALGIGTDGRE